MTLLTWCSVGNVSGQSGLKLIDFKFWSLPDLLCPPFSFLMCISAVGVGIGLWSPGSIPTLDNALTGQRNFIQQEGTEAQRTDSDNQQGRFPCLEAMFLLSGKGLDLGSLGRLHPVAQSSCPRHSRSPWQGCLDVEAADEGREQENVVSGGRNIFSLDPSLVPSVSSGLISPASLPPPGNQNIHPLLLWLLEGRAGGDRGGRTLWLLCRVDQIPSTRSGQAWARSWLCSREL